MTADPMGRTPPPDRRVAGGSNPMSASFDVMVSSMEALNNSVRQLSEDMRRAFDAQATFAPGGQGEGARRARQNMPGPGRVFNPQAGQTNQTNVGRVSLGRAAQNFAQRMVNEQQGQQQEQAQQTGPLPMQPYNPMTGYVLGPQMPFPVPPFGQGGPGGPQGPQGPGGGGPGGPGGPQGPQGPLPGPGGPQGPQWWGQGPQYWFGQNRGGGWTNMILGGARRIPYVGTTMAVIGAGVNLYQSEREKNRLYQGMEGGSNFAGFGERFHEEMYRWSRGAVMPGDMARRSFKGVTALGYTGKSRTGQGRQDALDFVSQNYKNRGMDVEESLGMLQTASHDATVKFGELSDALKEVSDTAGKAGVNAKFMRQSFQGMLQASIGTGAGPGSADLASIFSSTQASYGREFQGMDFRGQLDRGYQYMIGAQYGVSPGQLQGIMRNQPGQYARMVTGSQMGWIQTIFSPQQLNDLKALITKYGTSQQAIPQIEQEFLNSHPEIDLNVIADTLSGQLTGVQLDNSNVMDWVIQQLAGNTAAAHGPAQSSAKPVDRNNTAGARTGKYGLYTPDKNDTTKSGQKGVEEGLRYHGAGKDWWGGASENKAGKTYVEQMKKSGKRDPVLEALLQNVKDPNKTKVRVSTAQGDRIVSFEEAMRLFPNELASGKVQIVTGDQAGKSTSDIVGGNVDPTRDTRGELTGEGQQKAGQSLSDYEKKHGKIKSPGGDVVDKRVTVDLTEEAKKLLQLLPSTNNQSSATGYPPFNSNAQQGSRP